MDAASSSSPQSWSWTEGPTVPGPLTDDGLLVTTVNHTQDLLRLQRSRSQAGHWKSSSDWLRAHGLRNMGLSLSGLCAQGTTKTMVRRDGGLARQLEICDDAVREFEFQLYRAIELFHGRIWWINQNSMKVFGLVKGSNVGIIVDASDANCTDERLPDLKSNLLALIDEQLSCRRQLYLLSFGSETSSLWDAPVEVNPFRLQEARRWAGQLRPSGGCNLLQALRRGLGPGCSQLDSLVFILGSSPDQSSDVLTEYMEQCMLGRDLSTHAVSYRSSSPAAIGTVKRLAEATRGRHHVFSASLGVVDSSTDVDLLWVEIKVARAMASQVEALRQGRIGDLAVTVTGLPLQMSAEFDQLAISPPLPKPPGHDAPLRIKPPGARPASSADWLRNHGLKAKRLGLYQVLSPNAYSPLEGFVPVLNKTISSTVLQKAMLQCEWHDGTVKNVHVDLPSLRRYQRQLLAAVRALEGRARWLAAGSRHVWGSVWEQRVQVVVDVSALNSGLFLHVQHSLRLLLEEQLAGKHSFNIITFGSVVRSWKEKMVPPTPGNLQEAWQWVLSLQCSGTRNTLAALRQALEESLQDMSSPPPPPLPPLPPPPPPLTQAIYLFTSGVPDQEMEAVCSYVSECCGGLPLRLHVCLFSGEETDAPTAEWAEEEEGGGGGAPPPRYATKEETAEALRELAHAGNGRFHWISQAGLLESDDISALIEEMEKAALYWQKSSVLMEALAQRAACRCPEEDVSPGDRVPAPLAWRRRDGPIPPPRPTTLTLARLAAGSRADPPSRRGALVWRPSDARAVIPPVQPMTGWGPVRTGAKHTKQPHVSRSLFYLEDGNSLGAVFKSYPKPSSVRKSIPSVSLPRQEETCSTIQWLKRFGIKKLKLDLHKLVTGPDCAHQKKLVPSVLKTVSAKYCSIFPSVHVNGAVRHLQLTAGELRQYLTQTQRLLQRYKQRLLWLMTGSRRVFGVVLEREVCILLDVSGSMAPHQGALMKELASLVWDQLHHNRVRFSLLAFSDEVRAWRPALQEPSEEACRDAVRWACQLDPHGGTDTLGALQVAFGFGDRLGVYVLSDGKPDSSCGRVLEETGRLAAGTDVTVHTVSFNCSDSSANDFLKKLARQTGGRYHRCHDDAGALVDALSAPGASDPDEPALPAFEGDDLRRLAQEMDRLRCFRKQASAFREILLERKNPETNE